MVKSFSNGFGRRAAAEKVERRRRDGGNEAGAQRRRRAVDGSPPLMRPLELPLVTSAVFVKRNRRGRRGNGATAKPVK